MNFQACVKGLVIEKPLTFRLLIIMKLAILFTLLTIVQATASSYAQRITLKARDMTLSEALDEVHVQSGYQVLLNGKREAKTKVNVNLTDVSVKEAVIALLKGLPLQWTIKDNTIIIRPTIHSAVKPIGSN